MSTRFFSLACSSCGLSLLLTSQMSAQLPQTPVLENFVSPEARLEMMEKTYAMNLRPIHGPVMQDYLRELELLKNKMTAGGRAADTVAVDAEIARIRQAISTTGIFPYASANSGPAADPAKPAASGPGESPKASSPRTVLTLQAAKANGGLAAAGNAAPLGSLDWTVEKLAAGTYDIAVVYACPPLDAPEQITLSFAGIAQTFALPADRATGSDKDFRIFRLGTITVAKDVAAGNARLQSASTTPRVLIRSLILSRPKPAPPTGS